MRNYYEVLGVDFTASLEEIKLARSRRVAELAEQARTDPVAKAERDRVMQAWETLRSPTGRAAYDDALVFDGSATVVEDEPVPAAPDPDESDSDRLSELGALVSGKRAAARKASGFGPLSVRKATRRTVKSAGVRVSGVRAVVPAVRSPFDAGGWSAAVAQAAVAVLVVSLLLVLSGWRPDTGEQPRPVSEWIEEAS